MNPAFIIIFFFTKHSTTEQDIRQLLCTSIIVGWLEDGEGGLLVNRPYQRLPGKEYNTFLVLCNNL